MAAILDFRGVSDTKESQNPIFKIYFLMPSIMQDIKSLHPLLSFFIFEPPYLALKFHNFFSEIFFWKISLLGFSVCHLQCTCQFSWRSYRQLLKKNAWSWKSMVFSNSMYRPNEVQCVSRGGGTSSIPISWPSWTENRAQLPLFLSHIVQLTIILFSRTWPIYLC